MSDGTMGRMSEGNDMQALARYADWPVFAGEDAVWCDEDPCPACAAHRPGISAVGERRFTPRRLLEGIKAHAEGLAVGSDSG